jgi:hypothetical protein
MLNFSVYLPNFGWIGRKFPPNNNSYAKCFDIIFAHSVTANVAYAEKERCPKPRNQPTAKENLNYGMG